MPAPFVLIEEEWRPLPGFSIPYAVSSFGRVWSFGRYGKGRYLKPAIASHGYPTVAPSRQTRTVHSLVAVAFLGPYPPGQEVRHKDGDRTNPRLDNLEWGTRTENIRDAVKHGNWDSPKRRAAWEKWGAEKNKKMLAARWPK